MQAEIKLMKRLRHDNIVEYYGSAVKNNSLFIFME